MTPQVLDITPGQIDAEQIRLQEPSLDDVSRHVDHPTIVRDARNGAVLLAYLDLPGSLSNHVLLAHLAGRLPGVRTFQERARTAMLKSRSTTFGYQPRITLRRDYCGVTRLTRDYPIESDALFDLGRVCAHWYAQYNAETFWPHVAEVEREVLPEWRIPGTPFTGGIINETTALAYHRDNGNYKRTWSAMVVLREHVDGGWLIIPELDLALETAHASLTMFYGQDFWHGVSPVKRMRRDARRYSIVYYSLKTMRNCKCAEDEFTRYREVRTQRERNRRAGLQAGRPT